MDILEKRRILPLTEIKSQIIQPIDWPQPKSLLSGNKFERCVIISGVFQNFGDG